MSQWLRAAKRFEENSHVGNYFEAQSAIYALRRIQSLLETTFPQMFFLLGEPGSGKSFMLNHLNRLYQNKRLTILIENPFLTSVQLLQRLLNCRGIEAQTTDVEALRLQAIEAYDGLDHLIMLDEAQLMSSQMREFIRILSDSKVFYFLIAMHKKEGEEMLSSAHFHSRPHQVIYLGDLEPDECMPYIIKELQPLEIWDARELFSKNLVNKAWRYSNGNFRNFKKCFYHLFLFLDYAHTHNKKEFLKPNLLLLRMAAMRGRVLATELNTDDFEELKKEAKGNRISKGIIATGFTIAFVAGGLIAWGLYEKQTDSSLDVVQIAQVEPNQSEQTPNTQQETKPESQPEPRPEPRPELETKPELEPQPEPTLAKQTPNPEEIVQSQDKPKEPIIQESISTPQEIELDNIPAIEGALLLQNPQLPTPASNPPFLIIQPLSPSVYEEPKQVSKPSQPPKQNTSVLTIKSGKTSVSEMIERFESQPSYDLALRIATLYYEDEDYVQASKWGRLANGIDKEGEAAWIMYAKAQYGAGFKEEAMGVLRLFLEYKNSQEALKLLQNWEKEKSQ